MTPAEKAKKAYTNGCCCKVASKPLTGTIYSQLFTDKYIWADGEIIGTVSLKLEHNQPCYPQEIEVDGVFYVLKDRRKEKR